MSIKWSLMGSRLCGFVRANLPAAPVSNPKHTTYNFFDLYYWNCNCNWYWHWTNKITKKRPVLAHILRQISMVLPSLFIPMVRHFLSLQAWHWFLWALSMTQLPVPAWHLTHKFHQQLDNLGSCCGSVGRAVTSNTKGPPFESSHRQKFIYFIEHLFTVNCVLKRRK